MGAEMKLIFNMDIADESASINNTPGLAAQRLPFFTTASGRFVARGAYFTEREGLESNYLLLYTLAGRGRLAYRDSVYELPPGQAALVNCLYYHHYSTASEEPWDFKWVHIGGGAAAEYEERINGGGLSVVKFKDAGSVSRAMDSIFSLLAEGTEAQADVRICRHITEILTELIVGRHQPMSDGGLHRADVEGAMEYIRGNYGRKVGIDEIILRTHVSKYYFLRLFKTYTGLGLYEYLNNCRIAEAKKLLKDSDLTVGCIAQSVGFNDVNSFLRYFKKTTGTTPAVFRKYYLY